MTTIKTPDRFTYGISRKLSDGQYGSVALHVSYSSDMKDGEQITDLRDRVIDFTEVTMREQFTKTRAHLRKES